MGGAVEEQVLDMPGRVEDELADVLVVDPVVHRGPFASSRNEVRQPHLGEVLRDAGVGMSPEVQSKLFTPFFTTRGKGTGRSTASASSLTESSALRRSTAIRSLVGSARIRSTSTARVTTSSSTPPTVPGAPSEAAAFSDRAPPTVVARVNRGAPLCLLAFIRKD